MSTDKQPTIMDVAKRAQVSVGTVSNVLNGTVQVSQARRERVLQAIAELGFKQNMLAHGLRRRRSSVVGVCVPHTSIAYFAALVDAFEGIASSRGFEIMQVLSRQDPQQERQRIQALLRYNVGGLILVPSMEPESTYDLITASGVPVVIVDRPAPNHAFDQVTFDNRGAMFEATARLIALGHRHILFAVKQRRLIVTIQRLQGLEQAIAASGCDVSVEVLECGSHAAALTEQVRREFQKLKRPTAIIVSNSTVAADMLRALRALGISCPEGVSLLAFDEPEWADLVTPRLSVVRQPTSEMAHKAWEFLIARFDNAVSDIQRAELQAQVIFRESVQAPDPKLLKPQRRKRAKKQVERSPSAPE